MYEYQTIINKHQTFSNDLLMRSIKILDIGYITVIYVGFSIFCAKILDAVMGNFDPHKESKKSLFRVTIEIIISLWLYGVLIYIVRNLVEKIPFPLDGYHGFQHKRVKELHTAMVFTFTFVLFSNYLKTKLLFFYNNKLNKNNTSPVSVKM